MVRRQQAGNNSPALGKIRFQNRRAVRNEDQSIAEWVSTKHCNRTSELLYPHSVTPEEMNREADAFDAIISEMAN